MKTVTYLGKEFQVVNSSTKNGRALDYRLDNSCNRDLFSCYDRPSETKQAIYKEWKDLAAFDSNVKRFGIVSYNCQFFTLGWITEFHGQVVSIYVSKFHQYMIY